MAQYYHTVFQSDAFTSSAAIYAGALMLFRQFSRLFLSSPRWFYSLWGKNDDLLEQVSDVRGQFDFIGLFFFLMEVE